VGALEKDADPIMISALEHYSYCPRQCALIHLEQCFDGNVFTMRGHAAHSRVDEPSYEQRPDTRIERSLPIWSDRLNLVGRCDVVEFDSSGFPCPVEYKYGPRRAKIHDDIQLAAQAMCLEEMTGKTVERGAIYHVSSRRRREVIISSKLRQSVEDTVAAVRRLLDSAVLPPAVNDERCQHCSLKDICQPDAMANTGAQRKLAGSLFDPDS
jgi:CRISPR-associated exonuclease Cas4